jgi:hypothetical protein
MEYFPVRESMKLWGFYRNSNLEAKSVKQPDTVAPNSSEFRNGSGPYRLLPPDRKGRVLFCLWEHRLVSISR